MKYKYIFSLLFYIVVSVQSSAQDRGSSIYTIKLKSGDYLPDKGYKVRGDRVAAYRTAGIEKNFVLIQFNALPNQAGQERLKKLGIELLDYIPNYAYLASISSIPDSTTLEKENVRSIEPIRPELKIDKGLHKENDGKLTEKENGKLDVRISVLKGYPIAKLKAFLLENNGVILKESTDKQGLEARILKSGLFNLAEVEGVYYIAPVAPAPTLDNFPGVNATKANILRSGISATRNLTGEGITLAIGDNFTGSIHSDLKNRVINQALSLTDPHGDHTSGTIAGAGNINPLYTGMAPKSSLYYTNMGEDIHGISTLYPNQVRITSNSYGFYGPGGEYNDDSRTVDMQISGSNYPDLLHVFSAGNFGPDFRTARGGFQAAKNSLVVGNIDDTNELQYYSSRGPVMDGRLKPEIVAIGTNVVSTFPENNYAAQSGTSMSTPAVAGAATLLYQRYKQLNNNLNPNSALIKALLCNTADDLGNPGPDYSFGFGLVNLKRAVEALEENRFFIGTVKAGDSITHTITVPTASIKLKVMLYWMDKEAASFSAVTLVNNLNLRVKQSSNVFLPWILNPASGRENDVAIRGVDNLNNIEQVTLDNPSGSYSFTVSGKHVATGSQGYVVVYEVIQPTIAVTYPYSGESLVPGEKVAVRWDESVAGPFTAEYSTDNGVAWFTIATNIPAKQGYVDWVVPNIVTGKLLVRVKNSTVIGVSPGASSIIGTPKNLNASLPTNGQVQFSWNGVSGANSYDVFQLSPIDKEMKFIANTTSTSYTFQNITSADFYFSIRAKTTSGAVGRRAFATKPSKYRVAENPSNAVANLSYSYYEGFWGSLPDFSILTPLKSGVTETLDYYGIRNREDNYGIRYSGYLNIPLDGVYTFYVSARSTGKFSIGNNEATVQHSYNGDGEQPKSVSIALKAGKHLFKYDFFDTYEPSEYSFLLMSGPDMPRRALEELDFFTISTNAVPVVSITSPANYASFSTPANISLSANATDPDGSIVKVDFILNDRLYLTDYDYPYGGVIENLQEGSYKVVAKAYDNYGATVWSSPINIVVGKKNMAPIVSIISPINNSTYNAPASIAISANAADSDGTISKVELYNGTSIIATLTTSPYNYTWQNVPSGTYSITAIAYDNSNLSTVSTAVNISVSGTVPTNLALNKPATSSSNENMIHIPSNAVDGITTTRWSSIRSDPEWLYVDLQNNYNINRVKITWEAAYGRDYKVQVSSNASTWTDIKSVIGNTSLTNDWTGLAGSGRYLRVYGTARGTVYGYSIFELEVYGTPAQNAAPTVSLTSPANNSSYTAPASVVISASASDPDGSISKVELYNGTAIITTLTAAPYTFTWSNVPSGTYNITAKAYDNSNASSVSSGSNITVNGSVPTTNLALNKPATASSTETSTTIASRGVDGSLTTRWSSAFSDPQWLYVDLQNSYNISRVKINWEGAYGKEYKIQVSNDASVWTDIKSVVANTTLTNDWTGLTGSGRYVRIYGTARGTVYGYSIYELEVYGTLKGASRLTIDHLSLKSINLYPNPGDNEVNVSTTTKNVEVTVLDNFSRTVYKNNIHDASGGVRINTSKYKNGIYFIKIRKNDSVIIKRMIIQH